MVTIGNSKDVQVRILCSEACANTSPTVALVKRVAQDLHIIVHIETLMVGTLEQAQELRFLGSPTVQIDGLDIEPSARDSLAFGLA